MVWYLSKVNRTTHHVDRVTIKPEDFQCIKDLFGINNEYRKVVDELAEAAEYLRGILYVATEFSRRDRRLHGKYGLEERRNVSLVLPTPSLMLSISLQSSEVLTASPEELRRRRVHR